LSLSLKILGTSSATFTKERNQTAQALKSNSSYYLIDCGEGTQIQLKKYSIKTNKIDAVFISHLHGDHYLGLFGLLSSMSLKGREKRLSIFGPKGLQEIITIQLQASQSCFSYQIDFQEINVDTITQIYQDKNIKVEVFPVYHRIECYGYKFTTLPEGYKIIKSTLPKNIPLIKIKNLTKGKDVILDDGTVIPYQKHTTPPPAVATYAYCADTRYALEILPYIQGVDTLYHEATFTEEFANRAETTFHATASQAGLIAHQAQVKQLIIGHYSARYKTNEVHLQEAKVEFDNIIALNDGDLIQI